MSRSISSKRKRAASPHAAKILPVDDPIESQSDSDMDIPVSSTTTTTVTVPKPTTPGTSLSTSDMRTRMSTLLRKGNITAAKQKRHRFDENHVNLSGILLYVKKEKFQCKVPSAPGTTRTQIKYTMRMFIGKVPQDLKQEDLEENGAYYVDNKNSLRFWVNRPAIPKPDDNDKSAADGETDKGKRRPKKRARPVIPFMPLEDRIFSDIKSFSVVHFTTWDVCGTENISASIGSLIQAFDIRGSTFKSEHATTAMMSLNAQAVQLSMKLSTTDAYRIFNSLPVQSWMQDKPEHWDKMRPNVGMMMIGLETPERFDDATGYRSMIGIHTQDLIYEKDEVQNPTIYATGNIVQLSDSGEANIFVTMTVYTSDLECFLSGREGASIGLEKWTKVIGPWLSKANIITCGRIQMESVKGMTEYKYTWGLKMAGNHLFCDYADFLIHKAMPVSSKWVLDNKDNPRIFEEKPLKGDVEFPGVKLVSEVEPMMVNFFSTMVNERKGHFRVLVQGTENKIEERFDASQMSPSDGEAWIRKNKPNDAEMAVFYVEHTRTVTRFTPAQRESIMEIFSDPNSEARESLSVVLPLKEESDNA